MKTSRILFIIAAIAIPVIGYFIMHSFVNITPPNTESTGNQYFYTALIIVLGLAVPFFMLKSSMHSAHLGNPEEKELHLSDIPKDKDQISHTPTT